MITKMIDINIEKNIKNNLRGDNCQRGPRNCRSCGSGKNPFGPTNWKFDVYPTGFTRSVFPYRIICASFNASSWLAVTNSKYSFSSFFSTKQKCDTISAPASNRRLPACSSKSGSRYIGHVAFALRADEDIWSAKLESALRMRCWWSTAASPTVRANCSNCNQA